MIHFPYLMGLIIFTGSLFLMFLTVPWPEIKKFALFGIIGGFGLAIALILVLQDWLGFWIYQKVDLLYLGPIPLILSAAWAPAEIFFAHFLNRYQRPIFRFILILFIPLAAVGIHFIQIWNHMLIYYHWNLFATFLVSLAIHIGLAFYLNRVYRIAILI